jgi:hypothetical protein
VLKSQPVRVTEVLQHIVPSSPRTALQMGSVMREQHGIIQIPVLKSEGLSGREDGSAQRRLDKAIYCFIS